MPPSKSIWYHLGHAWERARLGPPEPGTAVVRRKKRRPAREEREGREVAWPVADEILSAAAWLVLDKVIGAAGHRRRPGVLGLARAGAAGALAALLVDLVRPLLRRDAALHGLDEETFDHLMAGFAQGLLYGALVEPRIPGTPIVKGALYGSVEFATDPAGGLSELLGSHTPQGRLPLLGDVLDGLSPHHRTYLEHVVFGIALALLYDPSRPSSGTRALDDEG